jgi:bacterioferritin-associated ferredoxin
MVVCLCANVTERELAAVIDGGATTVKEIGRRCGAGAGCGACRPLIRECIKQCRAAQPTHDVPVAAAALPELAQA